LLLWLVEVLKQVIFQTCIRVNLQAGIL